MQARANDTTKTYEKKNSSKYGWCSICYMVFGAARCGIVGKYVGVV